MRWKDFCRTKKFPKSTARRCAAKFRKSDKQVFYVLYHPAAALYQGSLREVLLADFKKIPKVLKAIEKEENI